MRRLVVSRRAERDLVEIWLHIGRDDPRAADRMLDRLGAGFRLAAEHPEAGALRDDIRADLRAVVVGPYLVVYRERDRDVQIVRVVHGARDLGALFRRGGSRP